MATFPTGALRSATVEEEEEEEVRVLSILAGKGDDKSKALVLQSDFASNDFKGDEDSYRLFPNGNESPILVYTRSADGYALDINSMNDLSEPIVLGIRTSQTGQITLNFAGMETFGEGTFTLYDTKEALPIDLSLQSEYTFNKTEDDIYLENRFFLSWAPGNFTPINHPGTDKVSVLVSGRNVEILTKDGTPIESIRIDDTQGRSLMNETHLAVASYRFTAPAAGVYIVKVRTDKTSQVRKIIVK
jgi:hypothetical protein